MGSEEKRKKSKIIIPGTQSKARAGWSQAATGTPTTPTVLYWRAASTQPSTRLRTRSTSPRECQAARPRVSDARESRGAHVSRVKDEGLSQFVCSIHVCVCTYTHTLTYVRE